MTALVFGDEKRAKPKPKSNRVEMMDMKEVNSFKKVKRNNPTDVKPIPTDETILGSILSESLPAMGENMVMITG